MHLGGVQGGGCEVVENVDVVHVCVCWGGGGELGGGKEGHLDFFYV